MYDVIIIWAWSAGYPAWMYASRYNLKNIIIGWQPGGALATSHKVENYPWILSAPGKEIMDNFKAHAIEQGSEVLHEMVETVTKNGDNFDIVTSTKKEFKSKKVILATWNNYRKLGVAWEKEFLWKGVSYCATCDWMFFKWRDIIIAWGWNTALTEALYLAEIVNKVYIVHRRDTFRAEDSWIEKVKSKSNIELVLNEEVLDIVWDVLWMTGVNLKSGNKIEATWIFVAIWSIPNISIVDNLNPKKDEDNCLIVDERQETSVSGLYAAWDVTTNSNKFKQTIMSAAEWCLAADSIHSDLI
jgi:thioredoxin reductase (NADPH)